MYSQLLQPFSYLMIVHPSKRMVDWLIPLFLTIPIVALLTCFIPEINVFGGGGFVQSINQFVQTLPGFYIAALAAIVSFSGSRMDELMPEPVPFIREQSRGKWNNMPLTRRRFLSMMFAFLTVESFLLVLLGVIVTTFAPPLKVLIPIEYHREVALLALSIYCFSLFQLLVSTFWGLYYLGTKIHIATD